MDLPTYTNIWRIEKRLYKLYDLRLPMPLPIVWIGVFLGVLAVWTLFLRILRVPFETPWHVLFLVPPGVVTWLSTRPVIESKRLTELLQSQVRYLGEPRTWCRMAPAAEPDEIRFEARIWRLAPGAASALAAKKAKHAAKSPSRANARATARAAARLGARAAAAAPTAPDKGPDKGPDKASDKASDKARRPAPAALPVGRSRASADTSLRAAVRPAPKAAKSPATTGERARAGAAAGPVAEPAPRNVPQPPAPTPSTPSTPRKDASRQGIGEIRPAVAAAAAAVPGANPDLTPATEDDKGAHTPTATPERTGLTWGDVTTPPEPLTSRRVRQTTPAPETPAVAPAAEPGTPEEAEAPGTPVAGGALRVLPVPEPDPSLGKPVAGPGVHPVTKASADAMEGLAPPASRTARVAQGRPEPGGTGPDVRPAVREHHRLGGPAPDARLAGPARPEPSGVDPDGVDPDGVDFRSAAQGKSDFEGAPGNRPAAAARSGSEAGPSSPPETGAGDERLPAPGSVPAPAGIGTEALRRLRRLAASAEGGTARPGPTLRPSPPPEPLPMAAEAAMLDAARPTSHEGHEPEDAPGARETSAGAAADPVDDPTSSLTDGSATGRAAGTAAGRPVDSASGPRLLADETTDPAADAREQHRKGRPPRPARPQERRRGPSVPVSIRAVPAPDPAEAVNPAAPAVPAPVARRFPEPKVRRVESVVGRDTSGGWRRLAQVVVGTGTTRTDGTEIDEARARSAIGTSKRIVVLGCTGGAGQTTTALMLGHTLAAYREDRVLAIDANNGDHTLSHLIAAESPETLTSLLAGLDEVSGYLSMRAYTTRCESGLEVIAADGDEHATQRLADRSALSDQRLADAIRMFDRHYKLILIDPAAAVAARVLPYADQLILVAPASADAPDAIAMTYEWLDGHGCSDLRRRAVMVVNGVSRRTVEDVEQAEAVASGRCRAIVRVPWEEELAPGGPGPIDLGHLRTASRRAYVALAGVVASGLGAERLQDRPARVANEDR